MKHVWISSYLLVLLMLEPEGGLYTAPLVQKASSHVDVSHVSGIPIYQAHCTCTPSRKKHTINGFVLSVKKNL